MLLVASEVSAVARLKRRKEEAQGLRPNDRIVCGTGQRGIVGMASLQLLAWPTQL